MARGSTVSGQVAVARFPWVTGASFSLPRNLTYLSLRASSQIQIASRTFHFILPPPAPPEDSPSPSSQSSGHRARSPSVDITSYSPPSSLPSESPPPAHHPAAAPKIPPPPDSALPNSNAIPHKTNGKKRKKPDAPSPPLPAPEVMPPKPQLTYAQLCYRAIKALGGKASLQEICQWIKDTYDWYKYCSKDWEVSAVPRIPHRPLLTSFVSEFRSSQLIVQSRVQEDSAAKGRKGEGCAVGHR